MKTSTPNPKIKNKKNKKNKAKKDAGFDAAWKRIYAQTVRRSEDS